MGYKRKRLINAPEEVRRLPFNLKRSHLYPVWSDLTAEAIEQFQANAPNPVAMVQTGAYMPPYRNAVAGIQALEDARAQKAAFQQAQKARWANMSQEERIRDITTVHTGNGTTKRIQHAVLGPDHRDIPFHPRSGLPRELQEAQAALYQAWRGKR